MAFRLSTHVLVKHLPTGYSDASKFFDKETMMECIRICINDPDRSSFVVNKDVLEKRNEWVYRCVRLYTNPYP